MKKIVTLLAYVVLFASTGCDSPILCGGKIWDFVTYDICFLVANEAGENLMDPEVEGNLLDEDIYVVYKGETYPMNAAATRANPPRWQGLRAEKHSYQDPTIMLKFGEFSPEGDHKGETFTIHWGDGTDDTVKFDLYTTWVACKPTVHKKLWLNGELTSKDEFTIHVVK